MKKNFQKSSRSNNLPNQKIFKEIKVNKSEELLVFLLNNFPSLSRNNLKKLLSNQQVLVNGAAVRQFNFLLAKDDIVSLIK